MFITKQDGKDFCFLKTVNPVRLNTPTTNIFKILPYSKSYVELSDHVCTSDVNGLINQAGCMFMTQVHLSSWTSSPKSLLRPFMVVLILDKTLA